MTIDADTVHATQVFDHPLAVCFVQSAVLARDAFLVQLKATLLSAANDETALEINDPTLEVASRKPQLHKCAAPLYTPALLIPLCGPRNFVCQKL